MEPGEALEEWQILRLCTWHCCVRRALVEGGFAWPPTDASDMQRGTT